MTAQYDVVIVGAGPAGLAAGLSLVRARRRTLLIDSNRPRNAATLHSHGFITRDGASPLELRRLGREEFEAYPAAEFHSGLVRSVTLLDVDREGEAGQGSAAAVGAWDSVDLSNGQPRFRITTRGLRGAPNLDVTARTVVIATGLTETLPALPSIRAWYGTNLHSCIDCDGYEKADAALALVGESNDLAERAVLISQWTNDLMVFTNGIGEVSDADEARLLGRGIRVDRRRIVDIVGERGAMTGIELEDGEIVAREAGFVRPHWTPTIDYLEPLITQLHTDDEGLIVVDEHGRTSIPGLYAAGDSTPPGPEQLMVAAGSGAHAAAMLNRDLLGPF
ncbi:NAD(P)/FAD-dependent oxidoreductase [Leifsonia sp. YAF41]|uniref:NAD(P)/FAD-dependent oxidoreductase n=1 Tax=Leifsonia sp. YAF41 TaxID=3233086 RepID=UPI003F95A947